MASESEILKIRTVCGLLYQATRSVRILTHVSWPSRVREQFFAEGSKQLPQVQYVPFDPTETLERLALARASIDFSPIVNDWLYMTASNVETSAKMLAASGTRDFFRYSSELFGSPKDLLVDQANTTLGLAIQFDQAFKEFDGLDLGTPEDAHVTSNEVATAMQAEVEKTFGALAPKVLLVDELSANACWPGRLEFGSVNLPYSPIATSSN